MTLVIFEPDLESDLSNVPVDIPLLHVVVAPSLYHITHSQVNTDQSVGGDPQDLIFSAALKPVDQKYLSTSFIWKSC